MNFEQSAEIPILETERATNGVPEIPPLFDASCQKEQNDHVEDDAPPYPGKLDRVASSLGVSGASDGPVAPHGSDPFFLPRRWLTAAAAALAVAVAVATVVAWLRWRERVWGGMPLYLWGVTFLQGAALFVVLHGAAATALWLRDRLLVLSSSHYFLAGQRSPAILLCWAVLQMVWFEELPHRAALHPAHSNVLPVVAIVAALSCAKQLAVKVTLAWQNRKEFWGRIVDATERQRIIHTLQRAVARRFKVHKFRMQWRRKVGEASGTCTLELFWDVQRREVSFAMLDCKAVTDLRSDYTRGSSTTVVAFCDDVAAYRLLWTSRGIDGQYRLLRDPTVEGVIGHRRLPTTKVSKKDRLRQEATMVFRLLGGGDSPYLTPEDFRVLFPRSYHNVFRLFDNEGTQQLSCYALGLRLVELSTELQALSATLHDRENVAHVLSQVVDVAFYVVVLPVALVLLGVDWQQVVLPFGTLLLGMSFVFGSSASAAWDSFILIFCTRTFEVGDRIGIDGFPTLDVARINLSTTELLSLDGRRFVLSNSFLRGANIIQYTHSKNHISWIKFQVGASTPRQVLQAAENEIGAWLSADKRLWKWTAGCFWVSRIQDSTRMEVNVWAELVNVKWSDSFEHITAQSELWVAVQEIFSDLGVTYSQAEQPVRFNSPAPLGGAVLGPIR